VRETHNFFKLHFHQSVLPYDCHAGCGAFRTTFHVLAYPKLLEGDFSRWLAVVCAMIVQNANNRGRRGQGRKKTEKTRDFQGGGN
jgi:hypothetical protein